MSLQTTVYTSKNKKFIVSVAIKFVDNNTGSFSFSFNSECENTSGELILPLSENFQKAFTEALNKFLNQNSKPRSMIKSSSVSSNSDLVIYSNSLLPASNEIFTPGVQNYTAFQSNQTIYSNFSTDMTYLNFVLYGAGGNCNFSGLAGGGGGGFVKAVNIPISFVYNNVTYSLNNPKGGGFSITNWNTGGAEVIVTYYPGYESSGFTYNYTLFLDVYAGGSVSANSTSPGAGGGTKIDNQLPSSVYSLSNIITVTGPKGGGETEMGSTTEYTVSGSGSTQPSYGYVVNTFNGVAISSQGAGNNTFDPQTLTNYGGGAGGGGSPPNEDNYGVGGASLVYMWLSN